MDLLSSSEPAPDHNLDVSHQREWVRDAVEALPEGLKQAVNLVYYQGLKYREAADILHIPVGTVKSRLHSAILKLNEAWIDSHPHAND
jgi:RNA polymerase sigma-70 factor (ECF subfamily)